MKKKRRDILLKALNSEIKKAKVTAKKSRETAKNYRAASRSQQGDRRLFETSADLAESRLSLLEELQKDLRESSAETPGKIKAPCWINLEFENGQTNQFYFVSKRIQISEVLLVSPDSPLGQAIANKKEGDNFSYRVGNASTLAGKITKIE